VLEIRAGWSVKGGPEWLYSMREAGRVLDQPAEFPGSRFALRAASPRLWTGGADGLWILRAVPGLPNRSLGSAFARVVLTDSLLTLWATIFRPTVFRPGGATYCKIRELNFSPNLA